ncbi:hypothetical protein [Desulfococcus sp.]|uniref:hypothetical protein n=1 Tax=Desulfococcus sp. TaxID=2025834 RepID=UPI003593E9E0
MQTAEQITESMITLEHKLSKISMHIDHLTRKIRDHRQGVPPEPGRTPETGAMNDWRRRSFELHRIRSEMKSKRDLLMSDITTIRGRFES